MQDVVKIMRDRKSIPLKGINCAACAPQIEKVLSSIDTVEDISVNAITKVVSFTYDSEKVEMTDILVVLSKAGFDIGTNSDELYDEELYKLQKLLCFCGIMCLPFMWGLSGIPQFIIATLVQVIAGRIFYKGALRAIKNRSTNMDVLIALGTTVIYLYSSIMCFTQTLPKLYFECSVFLITLILLGRYFETLAKGNAAQTIKKLLEIQPATAIIVQDGIEKEIPIEYVKVNDIVVVKPGNKIPTDGIIIEGETSIDESMITGESLPKDKYQGDEVIGGTYNCFGSIKVKVSRVGKDTTLKQIVKAVEVAQESRAPIQKLVDKIAAYFIPLVIIIAVITFIYWFFHNGEKDFYIAMLNASAVMIIACPCALGLATPTAILEGTSCGAERGILIKGGEALEQAYNIDTIVFDKTGTLTEGAMNVSDFWNYENENISIEEYQELIYILENKSEHPIAKAITDFLSDKVKNKDVSMNGFIATPGRGLSAIIDGRAVLVGNFKFMTENNVDTSPANLQYEVNKKQGRTTVFGAVDGKVVALYSISDTIRENAAAVVSKLKTMKIDVWMLTGDNESCARSTAEKIGIENVISGILPTDKSKEIEKLRDEGKKVAMIGDGINDAPALITADVGIAMGNGTDIAIESADIILVGNNLENILNAIDLSKITIRNIEQNLFWALFYNVVGIPLAAVGVLNPLVAGLAMSLSSLTVVFNALRIKKIMMSKEKKKDE